MSCGDSPGAHDPRGEFEWRRSGRRHFDGDAKCGKRRVASHGDAKMVEAKKGRRPRTLGCGGDSSKCRDCWRVGEYEEHVDIDLVNPTPTGPGGIEKPSVSRRPSRMGKRQPGHVATLWPDGNGRDVKANPRANQNLQPGRGQLPELHGCLKRQGSNVWKSWRGANCPGSKCTVWNGDCGELGRGWLSDAVLRLTCQRSSRLG